MIYILYNPRSQNGRAYEKYKAIESEMNTKDFRSVNLLELVDYQELVDDLEAQDIIYLIGGDGTLNRFVNYIKDLEIRNEIYFYPAGTGNDFWHDVDENHKSSRIHLNEYIDFLPIVTIYDKEYLFVNGIGYGIDGFCCEEGDRLQSKSNKAVNYTTIAAKGVLYKFKPRNAKITVDGITKEFKHVWLAPTMFGRYFGGGMKIAPNQNRKNQEHMVTNVVMYGVGRVKAMTRLPSLFTGGHLKYKEMIDIRQGHNITVEFDKPCALQVDGETFLNVMRYSVRYK